MSWITPITNIVGQIPRSSDLNQYIRDNFNAIYNILVASPFKLAIERRGTDANNWQTGGGPYNLYAPSDAFIQSGSVAIAITVSTSGPTNGAVSLNLPIALSNAGSGIALATLQTSGSAYALNVFPLISGSTGLSIAWDCLQGAAPTTINTNAYWAVIGR